MSTNPSSTDRMRLQLAKSYAEEVKQARLDRVPAATLVMMVERLEHAVEDLAALLETCWSENE